MRIERQIVTFDEDGVAEIPAPEPDDEAVHSHLRFDRLNDRSVEIFFTQFIPEDEDAEEELLGMVEFVIDEDDEDE